MTNIPRTIAPIILTAMATVLSACGGGGSSTPKDISIPADNAGTYFIYPLSGSFEVSTQTPVIFENLKLTADQVQIVAKSNHGTEDSPVEGEVISTPRGVMFIPASEWPADSLIEARLSAGNTAASTSFMTGRSANQPLLSHTFKETFTIQGTVPTQKDQVHDLSTIRIIFNSDLDPKTFVYGTDGDASVILLDKNNQLVPATLIIGNRQIVIDPENDLSPDQEYRLLISSKARSIYGQPLPASINSSFPLDWSFTPIKTSSPNDERSVMPQEIVIGTTHNKTGRESNQVPLDSTLLGESNYSQAHGSMAVELAYIPEHEDLIPFTIRKGNQIKGYPLSPTIGGAIPSGMHSGNISMTLMSDAYGVIYSSEGGTSDNAPKSVRLWLDLAITAEDEVVNSTITQNIIGLEVQGTAIVNQGSLEVEAVGIAHPILLEHETAYSLLSFAMRDAIGQSAPPQLLPRNTPEVAKIQAPNLGAKQDWQRVDVYFDQPVILATAETATLNIAGQSFPLEMSAQGNRLSLKPLMHSTVNGHEITRHPAQPMPTVVSALEDGHGEVSLPEAAVQSIYGLTSSSLTLPLKLEAMSDFPPETVVPALMNSFIERHDMAFAPIIIGAYPDLPCAIDQATVNLEANQAGRCINSFPGILEGNMLDIKSEDDMHPLPVVGEWDPIVITLDQPVMAESVQLGKTFRVEEVSTSGDRLEDVSGTLSIRNNSIKFTPSNPWVPGKTYRYTMLSSGYKEKVDSLNHYTTRQKDENYTCGIDSVCSISGMAIQTTTLGNIYIGEPITFPSDDPIPNPELLRKKLTIVSGPDYDAGGDPLIGHFRSQNDAKDVLVQLITDPINDKNGNWLADISNLGLGSSLLTSGEFLYTDPEVQPSVPLSNPHPLDPGGLETTPNAVKLLSYYDTKQGDIVSIQGINTGCAYIDSFDSPPEEIGTPLHCPAHKQSYILGSLFAKVKPGVNSNGGIDIELSPGILHSTSVPIYAWTDSDMGQPISWPGETGRMVMRMRPSVDSETGARTGPIKGEIYECDGEPCLEVTLDLYADAPYVAAHGIGTASNATTLVSYPIQLTMKGKISFTNDGRMEVSQVNTSEIDLSFYFNSTYGWLAAYIDLLIPTAGINLHFSSITP